MGADSARVRPNDNRDFAGQVRDGVLTLRLVARTAPGSEPGEVAVRFWLR